MMTPRVPPPSRRAIALLALSGLNAVALLGVSLWLITRASAQPPILYLQMAIVGVRAFALGRAFFRYVGRLASHDSAFRALAGIRSDVFEQLSAVGPLRLSTRQRGSLVSTLVRDVDSLQDHALRYVEPLWVNTVVLVTTIVTISIFSPIAGIVLAAGCAMVIVSLTIIDSFVARHAARNATPVRGELYAAVTERLRHDKVLRAFGATAQFEDAIGRLDSSLSRIQVAPALVASLSTAIATAVMGLVAMFVIVLNPVTDSVGSGHTAPLFTVVALISLALGEFLVATPAILEARRNVVAARERIADAVGHEEPQREGGETTAHFAEGIDRIAFDAVTARYPGSPDIAVGPVSFSARRGEVVIVSGPSGSGKSTIANLLVGFVPVETGSFTLNGANASHVPPARLRNLIGLCEQRPHIFAESLRHNLDFANDGATDEQLWTILDRVGLGEWARSRDGLDTQLGEAGSLLSGGQAQRVALARVLLADRGVVVLDEPTANLQPQLAENLIHDVLDATTEKILIVLSHTHVPRVRTTINVVLG